jgi:hypothetical protein
MDRLVGQPGTIKSGQAASKGPLYLKYGPQLIARTAGRA